MNKKIYIMFIMAFFLIGIVSASSEWDNKEKFDKNIGKYGKYEIYNSWVLGIGYGKKLMDLELTDNTRHCSENCVAMKDIYLDKSGSLVDEVKFYNREGEETSITNYTFYIIDSITEIEIDDYQLQCQQGLNSSGSMSSLCTEVLIGSHMENQTQWIEYIPGTQMKKGQYTLKLQGEKEKNQTVDWVVKSQGIWTSEWAIWGATNISVDVEAYYKLDKTTGIVIDEILLNNGTNTGSTRGVVGIINNSFSFDGINDQVALSTNTALRLGDQNFTVSAWINRSGITGGFQRIISKNQNNGQSEYDLALDQGGHIFSTVWSGDVTGGNCIARGTLNSSIIAIEGEWMNVVLRFDSSQQNMTIWVNGSFIQDLNTVQSDTCFNWLAAGGAKQTSIGIRIASTITNPFNGSIDEVGLWNRSLLDSEIVEIYASGVGLTYPFSEGIVTLNSPTNNFLSSSALVSFNCTADIRGGSTLVNMSLYTNESGSFVATNTTSISGTSNTTIFNRTFTEGTYLWTCQACDSDGDCGFADENRTFFVDITAPVIQIIAPNGTINEGIIGGVENLNWSINDTNLDTCFFDYNLY